MARIALALSGGGSKGAFTVGVLQALRVKLGLKQFRVISGTSTGSLIATMLATNDWNKLRQLYRGVKTENIINPNHALVAAIAGEAGVLFASAVIGGRAIFDQSALADTIRRNIDFAKIRAVSAKTLVQYNTVNLETGHLEIFDNKRHGKAALAKALLASASEPVLMEPVTIGRQLYTDGGVLEFLPLGAVFDSGVALDHIIAISTSPIRPRKSTSLGGIVDILIRTIDLFSTEVGRDDYSGAQLFNAILQMIENAEAAGVSRARILRRVPADVRRRLHGKRPIPVTFIGPRTHIAMDSLKFEPAEMKRVMALGVDVGKKAVPKLEVALDG